VTRGPYRGHDHRARRPGKAKSEKKATSRARAVIRPAVSVMWDEMPGHFGGAFAKVIVRPETCGAKDLDYRISVYQPRA